MKNYVKPDVSVVLISANDVIVTSSISDGMDLPEVPFSRR